MACCRSLSRTVDIYGSGVNLYNLRLLDNAIRFILAKDEEQAQMDTAVGSTTNEDANKRKSLKPLSRLWHNRDYNHYPFPFIIFDF